VPVMKEVCDPCTGERRQVQCGCRTETYQSGSHLETREAGCKEETFQCGTRCETYQCGTETRKEFAGYVTERVQVGTRTECYQSGTTTEQRWCGDKTELVQTGTCDEQRFKGWRTECEVVCPARTEQIEEVVWIPASTVTVVAAVAKEDVKPLPGTTSVLTEAEYRREVASIGGR